MVVKVAAPGRSFAGVAAYCLHDTREPGEPQPETSKRVEWTDTRNLPTDRPDRAAAMMAATAQAAPDLKRLAGGSAAGRKLEKPVCHYSLNWAPDERPDRPEMSQAVAESLEVLGLEKHQALVVAHNDTPHRHVHVVVNRVDLETGKVASLDRNHVHLSRWAQQYETVRGGLRCHRRAANNERRDRGERVQDRVSVPTARHRRTWLNPHREPRQTIPPGRSGWEQRTVSWQRGEERLRWERLQRGRGERLGDLERRSRREWAELYGSHDQQREQLAQDGRGVRGVLGRFRRWRQEGGVLGATVRGSPEVLGRWREDLDREHRQERAQLARTQFREVQKIEREGGDAYRRSLEGSEERAASAANQGWGGERHYPDIDQDRLRTLVPGELLQQVREVEGEAAAQAMGRQWRGEVDTPRPSPSPGRLQPGPDRGGGFER